MKLKKNILIRALTQMLKIKVIENNIALEFKKNKILSFLHLSIGQEACAAGVAMGVEKKDNFFGNHRSHAHYLAKNGNIEKMIFEVFSDKRGCCGGFGGSMHMLDRKVNFLGSIPILGSAVSIASGISMGEKLSNKNNITVIFLGDGAAEEGSFYETVNMAGLYKLPLLIVLEDNKYAVESTNEKRKVKGYNFNSIFKSGFNTIYKRTDGQDFVKVYLETKKIRKKILNEKKIGILHLDCHRFAKHSGANICKEDQTAKYRKNEYKKILTRDPINLIKKKMIKLGFDKNQIYKFEKKEINKINNIFYKTFKKINIKKI